MKEKKYIYVRIFRTGTTFPECETPVSSAVKFTHVTSEN